MAVRRGIFLVANLKSQILCESLIYSIRQSGCTLPIRLIHFGGEKVNSLYILKQVELLEISNFPDQAIAFINNLSSILTDCPRGFLYRFLAWFSDWDEFIYSDNDIIALMNWEKLFNYLPGYDIVHADEEYLTMGKFNHDKPEALEKMFGKGSLEKAFTAGHFVSIRNEKLIDDINGAVEWFKKHPDIPQKHDQALLHVAALIGNWSMLNLCKYPTKWLSTWAGDYKNSLAIIQSIQSDSIPKQVSHIHFSGKKINGVTPIEDLLFSNQSKNDRLKKLMVNGFEELSGLQSMKHYKKKLIPHMYKYLKNLTTRPRNAANET